MTLGEKLSKLRKESGYTQEQFAEILGVSRQSISKWESDMAYPETDKLIKIGKIFECSMDYLLKEDVTEKQGLQLAEKYSIWNSFEKQLHERKSKKMIFGMPLYHLGKNAQGFFAVGVRARGVFSFGLISRGVFSVGLLSAGVISIGLLSLGLICAGVFAAGFLAVGAIALGLFAAGAISVGLISFGALAIGKYAAVGDHAHAMIAIGQTVADGSVYSYVGDMTTADISRGVQWLDANVPSFLGWAKEIFKFYIQ